MKKPHECHNIEEVREEIDRIDNNIIGLIGERFFYIKEVVKYKKKSDDVFAADRHNLVIKKQRELATSHNLDPDVIENMYRIMMDYFIKEQLVLLKEKK